MNRLTTLSIVAFLVGCATQPATSDQFEGTYRFRDPNEHGYYVVTKVGPSKWNIRSILEGKPPQERDDLAVLAPQAAIALWFDDQSPRNRIVCLQSPGAYPLPFICRVPTDVSFQVNEAMSPNTRLRSKTGYVLLVGTPAGAIAVDLGRNK